ncbi:hypothetical protein V6N13_049526 [Hibiscus sabdariffa]|uniref:Uncharacterized protein n=1 Tax=Hibiscus sabdariffa TaxID=183260 RepID=A0ABR2QWV9_9ROSI
MMGVNSGRETWADVVVKNRLGPEIREEYRDQVFSFEPIEDMPGPPIIDTPLTHRDTDHNVSILDLGEDVDRSGLVHSWVESIDKLNTIHPCLHDSNVTLFSNDEADNSENSDRSLPEVKKKARQTKKRGRNCCGNIDQCFAPNAKEDQIAVWDESAELKEQGFKFWAAGEDFNGVCCKSGR